MAHPVAFVRIFYLQILIAIKHFHFLGGHVLNTVPAMGRFRTYKKPIDCRLFRSWTDVIWPTIKAYWVWVLKHDRQKQNN